MPTQILRYDPDRYDFKAIIGTLIGRDDLTALTADYADTSDRAGNSLYKNMEQSPHFARLYAGLESAAGERFYRTYERFIREVIRPQYDEAIYYQQRPSHRILFADTPGQSRFHRDRDYGHHGAEVNYLLVQTPAYATNTIWIESQEGKRDFHPIELKVGEYLRFKGVDLEHGAQLNETGRSRVSFDFRVLPASKMPTEYLNAATEDVANPVQRNARKFGFCA